MTHLFHHHFHVHLFTAIIFVNFYTVSTDPSLRCSLVSGQSWVAWWQVRQSRYREHDANWCHYWRILRRLGQTTHETWYASALWLPLNHLHLSLFSCLHLQPSLASLSIFLTLIPSAPSLNASTLAYSLSWLLHFSIPFINPPNPHPHTLSSLPFIFHYNRSHCRGRH